MSIAPHAASRRSASATRRAWLIPAAAGATVLALATGALILRSTCAHLDVGPAGTVVLARGLALPVLGSSRVIADTGLFPDDLSPEGHAAVAAHAGGRYGTAGDPLGALLQRSLADRADAELASGDDPARIAELVERERALRPGAPRLADIIRKRLLAIVERAHECRAETPDAPRGEHATDCARALDESLTDALARGLATLQPSGAVDPEALTALSDHLRRAHPEDRDFVVAAHILDALGADQVVVERLLPFLRGSDLGARAAAMRALSSIPVRSALERAIALVGSDTWLRGERPLQDWITDGDMAFSALALEMSFGHDPDLAVLESVLRRPARDLGPDGFFYDDAVVRAVELLRLRGRPIDDARVLSAVKALCNDAIRNAQHLLKDSPRRFRRFWRSLVEVARAQGVDPGKLVFAIFDGEGDFGGPASDDPVLIALDVLASANPADDPLGGGARDLVKRRLGDPVAGDCFVERLATIFDADDPRLPARVRDCVLRGDPTLLAREAQKLVAEAETADKVPDNVLDRLAARLFSDRADGDAAYRRTVEAALVDRLRARKSMPAALRYRLARWESGPLHRRITAGRILSAIQDTH